jgi:GT2 family glycosyltransferase
MNNCNTNQVTLGVIIVNYNVKDYLKQCIDSVYKASQSISYTIYVVDNNSTDDSVEMIQQQFPKVKLISNKKNTGFAVANNQAIKICNSKYVLLLNPDTIVKPNTVDKTIAFMEKHNDAGALGVKMFNGEGEFLPESKRGLPTPMVSLYKLMGLSFLFPTSKTFAKYHLGHIDMNTTAKVDVLSGAFMLIRKEVLNKVGLLDETFFMFGEDIDLSYRITLGGYNNYYFSDTDIVHFKGKSSNKNSIKYINVFYKAMLIFAKKHYSKNNLFLYYFLIYPAVYLIIAIKILTRFAQK